jgi:DNA polymerase III epsilon subunit-like protein
MNLNRRSKYIFIIENIFKKCKMNTIITEPLYMIFDLETSGLPTTVDFKFHSYKSIEHYQNSKIVQMSYGIYDDAAQSIKEYDAIRNPGTEFKITNSDIHGITNEKACKDGIPFIEMVNIFYNDLKNVQYLVVHNANFDINVLKSELFILNRTDVIEELEKKKLVCTMRALTDFCKLPSEMYKYIFHKEAENLHNSLYDVRNTAACFFVLKKLILFMTDFLDRNSE